MGASQGNFRFGLVGTLGEENKSFHCSLDAHSSGKLAAKLTNSLPCESFLFPFKESTRLATTRDQQLEGEFWQPSGCSDFGKKYIYIDSDAFNQNYS